MLCPLCQPQNEDILLETKQFRIIAVHDEANTPAFCRVIWREHIAEMTDLSAEERAQFMHAVFTLEAAMRHVLRPSKINLASLGNMVPHLHWHIIARFQEDAHFPAPIWSTPQRPNNIVLPPQWQAEVKRYLIENI